jgi:cytochrome c553
MSGISKMKHLMMAGLVVFGILPGCQSDPDLAAAPELSFRDDIQPILSGNCTMSGCHSHSGESVFPLDSYSEVAGRVEAGSARGSELYKVVANRTDRLMPPAGPLADADIQRLYIWIEQGAKNN